MELREEFFVVVDDGLGLNGPCLVLVGGPDLCGRHLCAEPFVLLLAYWSPAGFMSD